MPYSQQQFKADQQKDLPIVPTHDDVKNGTYIVTGSNTGIGFEAVKHLVRLGAKRVILAVRSVELGNEAKAKIEKETGNTGIAEVWSLDLASNASVVAFAQKARKLDRLDALVENAGVAMAKPTVSEGLETCLTVNAVNTLFLAVLVLPKLQESAKRYSTTPAISFVGGGTWSTYGEVLGKAVPSGDILDGMTQQPMNTKDINRYSVSKMLLYYGYRELAALKPFSETGVVINHLMPGFCVTKLNRNAGWGMWLIIEVMRLRFARTAEMGSRTLLHGFVAGPESHGKYLSSCEIKEEYAPDFLTTATGQRDQERVWRSIAARLNKVEPGCV